MKYKYIAVTILILGVMATCIACGGNRQGVETPEITPTPTGVQPIPTELLDTPAIDVTWLSPGKVEVGNFYAGATAEYPMRVHNGNNVSTPFTVAYRIPDNFATGFLPPTPEVANWVTIIGADTPLEAYETRDLTVTLSMPYGAVAPAHQWEFWISVKDNSQAGFVQTELCTRWLITMME